jgi:hypothetical protein
MLDYASVSGTSGPSDSPDVENGDVRMIADKAAYVVSVAGEHRAWSTTKGLGDYLRVRCI